MQEVDVQVPIMPSMIVKISLILLDIGTISSTRTFCASGSKLGFEIHFYTLDDLRDNVEGEKAPMLA